jgi:aromatic-L-amino-acid decarboxylase
MRGQSATEEDDVSESHHMSEEAFRRHARDVVDWVVEYRERRVNDLPVLSQVEPGEIRARLPVDPPERGEPFEAMLRDVDEILLPGITHWQSPDFFAFFPANTSYPAILGELLAAGLGVQGMLWATSPACTELETHVLEWLAEMLDLPAAFRSTSTGGGVIEDSASSATLCAMLAARERATEYVSNRRGLDRHLIAYASSQAHSSVEKAIGIAGIGRDNLRLIEVDESFAMRADRLQERIAADRAEGGVPFFVCATIGTTSSSAIDPVPEIGAICRREGLWLHVDAAMSGTAAVCPEFRYIHDGLEQAASYCFNPHKWMFTTFDCDCFYVADRAALVRALTILPEYLRNRATESGAVIDYRDWQVPLGRRFRALKLWFVIRHYGIEGLQYHVRRHVELAQRFRSWVESDERFELAAPVPLNLVCFRRRGDDAVNRALLDRINASGDLYLTHTVLDGKFTLRFCVGQTRTEERNVTAAWEKIRALATSVEREAFEKEPSENAR